jgi:thiamine-phosphate pyrophosphorylase
MAINLARALELMLVTDDALVAGRDLIALFLAAERGGVTSIQLRLKEAPAAVIAALAREALTRLTVPLIINDRLDAALAVGAHGVHLGPDDVPAAVARRTAPPGFIIGVSVGLPGEVANGEAGDYWGIGPWAVSATKAGAGMPLGPDGFAAIQRLAGDRPCVAIGGITPDDVPRARAAGAIGVAVVSGILGASDVEQAARRYASR